MDQYSQRIPVAADYLTAVGAVVYNSASLDWAVVYLGSLLAPDFVASHSNKLFVDVARDFSDLAGKSGKEQFITIAKGYSDLACRRQEFLEATPITGPDAVQELEGAVDSIAKVWTQEAVDDFASLIQNLDIEAVALYYQQKSTM